MGKKAVEATVVEVEVASQTLVPVAEISLKDMALQEIGAVSAGITALTEKYLGKTYEVTTTKGMDEAKAARLDIREKRYKIPHIVKEKKQALKKIGEDIQAEGDRITAELLALETPIHEQIQAEEERKERIKAEKEQAEKERKDAIIDRIDRIKGLPLIAVDAENAEELEQFIAKVEATPIGADFAEFTEAAQTAKTETVEKLKAMLSTRKEQEAEAARIREEQAERERVSAIRDKIRAIQDWPRGCVGLSSTHLIAALKGFEAEPIGTDFAELQDEAKEAAASSIAEIRRMLDSAAASEAEAAKLKAEREELEALREEKRLKDEADEKERQRVAVIRDMIAAIKAWPLKCLNMHSQLIREEITASEMDVPCCEEDGYGEFIEEAEAERVIALNTMTSMAEAAETAEKAEAERQRVAAEEKAKAEEQERERLRLAEEKAAEERRKEEEKRQKEYEDRMNALTATHLSTLQAILDMAKDKAVTDATARKGIISLATAGIERGAK